MDLTTNFVEARRPRAESVRRARRFLRHHYNGSDYQRVLDALVRACRVGNPC